MTSTGESVPRDTADWGKFLSNHQWNISKQKKMYFLKLTNYSKEELVKKKLDVELTKEW